jgi:hypothetical protein
MLATRNSNICRSGFQHFCHFVSAAEGRPDIAFWGSVCNLAGASEGAGDPIPGWISVFFPYLDLKKELQRNDTLGQWSILFQYAKTNGVETPLSEAQRKDNKKCIFRGIKLSHFPTGLSSAPVLIKWADVGIEQDLKFYGGICAVHQHEDGALEPRTGWAVVEPMTDYRISIVCLPDGTMKRKHVPIKRP